MNPEIYRVEHVIMWKVMRDYDLPEIEKWFDGFQSFGEKRCPREKKLEVMRVLMDYFEHPERACPCFHVGGSKGKGTISMGVAKILTEAGKKIGVYMSPHVVHFTERIRLGDGAFEPEVYERAFEVLKDGIEEILNKKILQREQLTWFMLVTTFAMLVFREAKVDFAVYEVGIGGRLDVTNVVLPIAIGMGEIELEHTRILGETVREIAREKAGIFKEKVPIFSVLQVNEARSEFAIKAREMHARIGYIDGEGKNYLQVDEEVAKNMALVAIPNLEKEVIQRGLAKLVLPGRYEKIEDVVGVSYVLMDGAHTTKSIEEVIQKMNEDGVRGVLIFGCSKGKRVEEIAKKIVRSGIFSRIFLTKPGEVRNTEIERVERAFEEVGLRVEGDANYKKVIQNAFEFAGKEGEPVIVLGSFYLVGEVKKIIERF